MSFAVLVHTVSVAPQSHLPIEVSTSQLIFCSYLLLCASNGPSLVIHSGKVSSPIPFHVGYECDHVFYSYLLMVFRILSFTLTFGIFLSIVRLLVLKLTFMFSSTAVQTQTSAFFSTTTTLQYVPDSMPLRTKYLYR